MFRGISKEEALWELVMLVDETKQHYVNQTPLTDVEFADTLRRLVKITSRVGGVYGMNLVFGGEVGRTYSKNPIIRWVEKMVDRYYTWEEEDDDRASNI